MARKETGKEIIKKTYADVGTSAPISLSSAANRKARKTHPETQAILTEFIAAYSANLHTAYTPSFARDQRILSDLITASSPNEVRTRMKHFFENGTKRTRDTGDYGVPAFRWAFNTFGVLIAQGDL